MCWQSTESLVSIQSLLKGVEMGVPSFTKVLLHPLHLVHLFPLFLKKTHFSDKSISFQSIHLNHTYAPPLELCMCTHSSSANITGKTDGPGSVRICALIQTVDGIGRHWVKNLNDPSPPKEA